MGKHTSQVGAGLETRPRWWRAAAVVAGGAAVAGMLVGVAGAQANSTTDVAFVTVSPAFKVLTNVSIAANKTDSPVVIGGSTTVPTNASTVELSVTAGGTAAGTLNLYPAGNVGGGSGQFLSWAAHGTDTATVQENVGSKDELTFDNVSSAAAKVTATIIGYSTQVTPGDISPNGGVSGQVLTNTGTGAAWQTAGQAYADAEDFIPLRAHIFTYIASMTVPAGSYLVGASGVVQDVTHTSDLFACDVFGPLYSRIGEDIDAVTDSSIYEVPYSEQGLAVLPTGGTITVQCVDTTGNGYASSSLTVTQVNGVTGDHI